MKVTISDYLQVYNYIGLLYVCNSQRYKQQLVSRPSFGLPAE